MFSRWRARRPHAAALRALGDCPACRHPWVEHGFGNDRDGVCGECAYEVEHENRAAHTVCGATPPTRPGGGIGSS